MFCVYTKRGNQVSVYRTIGPLVQKFYSFSAEIHLKNKSNDQGMVQSEPKHPVLETNN